MFTLLSNSENISSALHTLTDENKTLALKNLTAIINLLNAGTSVLLNNRRELGVLLPNDDTVSDSGSGFDSEEQHQEKQNIAKLLLNQHDLIRAINSLCLTEAVLVRNNFSDVVETITGENTTAVAKHPTPQSVDAEKVIKADKTIEANTNNVSPIRLTEIKRRLANAAEQSDKKTEQIKNKLNTLISSDRERYTTLSNKHA